MCELCDTATVQAATERARRLAEDLDKLAGEYRSMARGYIKPHSPACTSMGVSARKLIRDLVEEWL